MALEDFRVAGIGQVLSINVDTTAGDKVVIISAPGSNDHTATDNWDVNGDPIVWTQPQPQIFIYKVFISQDTALYHTLSCDDGTNVFINAYGEDNGIIPLSCDGVDGKLPLFVCNANTNFCIEAVGAGTINVNYYVQYRIHTPKN